MNEASTKELPRSDLLAVERTRLAVERTFLAYFRTAGVFLSSGVAILAMEFFVEIRELAWGLIGMSPLVLGVGVWRTKRSLARIEKLAER